MGTTTGTHMCPGEPSLQRHTVPLNDGSNGHTVTVSVVRELVPKQDIRTHTVLGMYCLPSNNTMMNAIIDHAGLNNHLTSFYTALHGMMDAKNFLIGVAFASIISGYLFLWFLRLFAGLFIHILMVLTVLGTFVIGLVSIALALGSSQTAFRTP